tara:strand:- start:308 stop:619 length:312 start_codon:yes stop_codon:yes gene_type:complete
MAVNIRSTKVRVQKLLLKTEYLRDNDDKLIATVLFQDIRRMGYNPADVSGLFVLDLLAKGKLTNPESIRRSRAKLQENHPELRGEVYKKRQEKAQRIKKDLGY